MFKMLDSKRRLPNPSWRQSMHWRILPNTGTGTHIERAAVFSRNFSEKLKEKTEFSEIITDEYIENIYKTSPLHEIGKVGIDDSILRKEG